jgi:hypothetical protein
VDTSTRRFIAGLAFLSVGNMWIVGGFVTTKEVAVLPMFLFGLFMSIQGAWMVFISRPRQG